MGNSNGGFDIGEHLKSIPLGLGQHLNFNNDEGGIETAIQSNDERGNFKNFKLSHAVFRGDENEVGNILKTSNSSLLSSALEEQDHDMNTPVHWACLTSRTTILKMLLEKNIQFRQKNRMGDTPLHFACSAGFSEGVDLLLKSNAAPWVANNARATPLHCAVASGRADIVGQLRAADREAFANSIDAQTRQGDTALHWAAAKVRTAARRLGSF
jgi:ankyrin repeat protein